MLRFQFEAQEGMSGRWREKRNSLFGRRSVIVQNETLAILLSSSLRYPLEIKATRVVSLSFGRLQLSRLKPAPQPLFTVSILRTAISSN